MDTTSPAVQAKLSLMLIIVFSMGFGIFGIIAFEGWLRGDTTMPALQAVIAVLFLGVTVLHARKVYGLIR